MTDRMFLVSLQAVSTEQGGRKAPFRASYRPQFHIANSDYCTSFMIQKIDGREQMRPGEDGVVEALLLSPGGLDVPIAKGMEFELREGRTIVARGIIDDFI